MKRGMGLMSDRALRIIFLTWFVTGLLVSICVAIVFLVRFIPYVDGCVLHIILMTIPLLLCHCVIVLFSYRCSIHESDKDRQKYLIIAGVAFVVMLLIIVTMWIYWMSHVIPHMPDENIHW